MNRVLARTVTTLAALVSTACVSYRPIQPLSRADGVDRIPRVVLRLANGERMELYDVQVSRDSVIGRASKSGADSSARRAVATADVVRIEEARLSKGKTIGAIFLIYLGVSIIAAGAVCASALSA